MTTRSALILSDEQLEHWARVYSAMPWLGRHGITFERFLTATPQARESGALPALAMRARIDQRALDFSALRNVMSAMERAGACCANGRLVEKLKHHRHPRGRRDFEPQPDARRASASERAEPKKEAVQ